MVRATLQSHWDQKRNRKIFFEQLGKQLGYKTFDDWYNVTLELIHKNGGKWVPKYFRGSPSKALLDIYPKHNWMLWRFNTVPNRYWQKMLKDPCEQTRIIDWCATQLNANQVEDW